MIWRTKNVTEHMLLRSNLGESLYYLCPGCKRLLPREYMRFCDCCGQKLGWAAIEADEQREE